MQAEPKIATPDVDAPAVEKASGVRRREVGTVLDSYLRDVSQHTLLTSNDELQLAESIEFADVEAWRELFSYAPVTHYLVDFLSRCMENRLPAFARLKQAATQVRKARTKAAQKRLTTVARNVGSKLRALDLDRVYRSAIERELYRLERQGAPRNKVGFVVDSQGFRDFLSRVQKAESEAARHRRRFVSSNLRLVITVARKYRRSGMPLTDLIQEGNLGLIKAVDRYDYRRGLRFSTYATWWIRHTVGRAVAEKARTVRLPVHVLDTKQRLAKVRRQLSAELGRMPTVQEISKAAEVPARKVEMIERELPEHSVSLDAPFADDEGRSRIEVFQDPSQDQESALDDLVFRSTADTLNSLIRDLRPMEADVIRQRFGFGSQSERTLQSIAEDHGLSRERIRQIQEEALRKLRAAMAEIEKPQ